LQSFKSVVLFCAILRLNDLQKTCCCRCRCYLFIVIFFVVTFQERSSRPSHLRGLLRSVTKDAVVASQRRATLASDWSTILAQLVRDSIVEMGFGCHDDEYAKRCFAEETQGTQASSSSSAAPATVTAFCRDSTVDNFRETTTDVLQKLSNNNLQ